jgi:5'-deoxynucleotidase YfbR-like HD superfamily hydrolase
MSFVLQTAKATSEKSTEYLPALVPLFQEIGNLKRIRAANMESSFAARLFELAWRQIIGGINVRTVAVETARDALVAAKLGAIDREVLRSANLTENEIETILHRAFDAVAAPINVHLRAEMREFGGKKLNTNKAKNPRFVELLARQPRSGATKVGTPKMIFDQPENHAEHSVIVGVYACLLAPVFHADIEIVFFAALTHHFHNAYLPDSGFAGEESLGEFLTPIFGAFRRKCLAEIPENLHEKIRTALKIIETADAPEAKAFHAADVIDRVLQMRHHAEANEFTLKYAMEEAELVHAGAIQDFHYDVLRSARLI